MSQSRRTVCVLIIFLALPAYIFMVDIITPSKSMLQRAYERCELCGIDSGQVDDLLRSLLESGDVASPYEPTSEAKYERDEFKEVCRSCAERIFLTAERIKFIESAG